MAAAPSFAWVAYRTDEIEQDTAECLTVALSPVIPCDPASACEHDDQEQTLTVENRSVLLDAADRAVTELVARRHHLAAGRPPTWAQPDHAGGAS